MAGPGEELVDVVDRAGAFVRQATRAEVRAAHLWHRAVFVAVVSTDGRSLLAHQRAHWKDVWPGRFDIAFGGVLAAGETFTAGAARELAEEAGVSGVELRWLGDGTFDDGEVREQAEVFAVRADGPFSFSDGEVIATEWVLLEDLAAWIGAHDTVPDSVALVGPLLSSSS